MTRLNCLTKLELIEEIKNGENRNVGVCVGIADILNKTWKFSIYLGSFRLLILFDKETGVYNEAFDELCSAVKSQHKLDNSEIFLSTVLSDLSEDAEYYKYKYNIYEVAQEGRIKITELLSILKQNLNQIKSLDDGDVVAFKRSLYHHHALLTDSDRMIITHLSGEPNDPAGSMTIVNSLIGLPTEKAEVTEDHLIETAGFSLFSKRNDQYDKCQLPREREEIVEEARRRIGEKGYSLTKKNCQHFVSLCRNGTSSSPEVQSVASGAFYTSVFLFAGLGAALFSKFLQRPQSEKEEKRKIEN